MKMIAKSKSLCYSFGEYLQCYFIDLILLVGYAKFSEKFVDFK